MGLRSVLTAGLVVGLLGAATPARAVTITGNFGIAGSVTYDTLNLLGDAGLDFQTTLPPPTSPTGPFTQVTTATGYFSSTLGMGPLHVDSASVTCAPVCVQGTVGAIKNISDIAAGPNYTVAPSNTPINVNSFLASFQTFTNSVAAASGLVFNMTQIPNQSGFPNCPTVSGSCEEGPFLISQTASGITVAFNVLGNFVNGADSGAYTGTFTVTMDGLTLAEAGNRLLVTGQDLACGLNNLAQPCAFAATFTPTASIPEPATLLTFGVGSLLVARARRRKKQ
jgi:hypothetical protein